MAQIPQKILRLIPPGLQKLLAGNARQELLARVEHCLLLFGDSLHTVDGANCQLRDSRDAGAIATAARQLLGQAGEDEAVLLLLPPGEFIATSQALPGVGPDTLASAMELQQENLLPTCEAPLQLAINGHSTELGDNHYGLWIAQSRLDNLYQAFADQGLFLAAVKPRLLAVDSNSDKGEIRLIDQDPQGPTALSLLEGAITQCLQLDQIDLQQEAFVEQWQQELQSRPSSKREEFASAADYQGRINSLANIHYSFFPRGALAARKQVERKQRLVAAAAVLLVAGLLSAVPFLYQSLQFRQMAAELEQQREMAASARANQARVVAFENRWGPLNDFPDQNVRQALFTLQEALAPERLSSLEISEGLISIQGSSEAPQAILQRLEQDPLFTEVGFARATSNARYYIDLRLSTVNFDSYMLRYFPDE
jgi:hypothetical protein